MGWIVKPRFTNGERWSIGHNGYTGTSMAICFHDKSLAMLLTNRVHLVRDGKYPEDKSVGIMMLRKSSWSSLLKFYEASTESIEDGST